MEQHDNSVEMWKKYYSSNRGNPIFEKIIHLGRKVYFGDAFAKTVIKLGGRANSYLETGVGTGQTLVKLQKMTGAKCTGIEKTPEAYELGKEYAKDCNIILGDALAIAGPDKSFDVSYSLGLFEHFNIDEQKQFMSEQARVTRNKVLIEVPCKMPHMISIMWFNRNIRKLRGVWADDELFSKKHFENKFPGLTFVYHFDIRSFGMTCWFILKPDDITNWLKK